MFSDSSRLMIKTVRKRLQVLKSAPFRKERAANDSISLRTAAARKFGSFERI